MPRKRTGYDAACYYDGKLLGRCTKADSDAYTLLMNACGGEAARVLREYAYFSPELKAILEKAALMQADRSRTGGMFHAPKSSPWGEVQNCETLCPGVFLVSTASHGGAKAHRTGGGSTGTRAREKGQPPSLSAPDRCGGAGRRWDWLLFQDLQAEA